MMHRTGPLKTSLLSKTASGAVNFVGRQSMVMGTDIDYAKYHQSDDPRKKIPQRKIIFIDGGPAEKAKDAKISGRREAWLNIINTYIQDIDGIT